MTITGDLCMVNLDSSDPAAHAAFYARVLGWEITHSQPEYAMVTGGGVAIGFGLVDGYAPPAWPDPSGGKRYHLDVYVDDRTAAEEAFCAAGASKPEHQPGGERWTVLLDPVGQPFCVCPRPQG
ncbi:VOC family protein [Micromonospora olivasterospora]|uniref:Putative enzyme related to lactoylglutathione lyase n=1 Tax=Micromonospora olivasterospora TaxID=1880 RepID=A0A562IHI2_MICOL|nr:VOC family protein [Micromonospora olivasterospora]TWH70266.1 putative enzyme related to lactoylglutathione lyase [Micromonospora olivasterospora]